MVRVSLPSRKYVLLAVTRRSCVTANTSILLRVFLVIIQQSVARYLLVYLYALVQYVSNLRPEGTFIYSTFLVAQRSEVRRRCWMTR
jgi:hypothetical protein